MTAKSQSAQQLNLVDAIDRLLPQTQCTQCGYPSCIDYARAISGGEAINQCPPGGDVSIRALADLLEREALPLNPANGDHRPLQLALIIEADCIGCKLCIKACPVDCIVGAAKLMHTVIANDCSGCELCLPVCPTDCIKMVDAPAGYAGHADEASIWAQFSRAQVEKSRRRAHAKRQRQAAHVAKRNRPQLRDARPADRQQAIRAALARKQA